MLTVPDPWPRQRCSPSASATPSGVATSTQRTPRKSVCRSAPCSEGSWRTLPRLAREPAQREPLPGGARAAVVEREQDGERHRDERPEDVDRRDQHEEARPAPRVPQPVHAAPASRRRCAWRAGSRASARAGRRRAASSVPRPRPSRSPAASAGRSGCRSGSSSSRRRRDRACSSRRTSAGRSARRPASTPGIESGSVTRRKAANGLAPRSRAASICRWSIRSSTAKSGRIRNGT